MSSGSKLPVSEPEHFKHFKLIDFEKFCSQQSFKLPPEILTPEILAKASNKAKAVRTSSRVPKPKKTDEANVVEGLKRNTSKE